MNLKKIIGSILICIVSISFCCGCKKRKNPALTVYKNFYEQDITTFNYILTNNHSDYTHIANFVDGLVENDKYGNIVPSIAKSWTSAIINNKQIWTFNIRENVYWSDYNGKKYGLVTAHDFVTTLKYILNYNIKSNHYSSPASLLENGINYYNATLIENYNYDDIIKKIEKLSKNDPNGELSTYNKIKQAFDFCNTNICSSDFSTVGVKAVSDYELQFTLENPSSYFLSVLTYCSFLPTNEQFIKEVGFNNFGTNKKYLLYSGAYILKDYFHTSKIEYIKNQNYWDKEKVYIDKIVFNRLMNYHSASYTRLAYETGNIDGFYVNPIDENGWNKYVIGNNNEGSPTSPIGNNTYLIEGITDFTTYHLLFNQNRINNKYSSLSPEEIKISNLALSNDNFRRSLVYGLKSDLYSMSFINEITSTIIPSTFVYSNGKDYHTYFLEEYAKQNNISYIEALNKEKQGNLLFDKNKSSQYLNLALNELNLPNNKLPIKIEFSYFYSKDYTYYDHLRIKEWNNILNGCEVSSQNCTYDKVKITFNESLSTYNDFTYAIKNDEYSLSFIGVYPNYIDPTAYLEAFGSSDILYPFLKHNKGNEIDVLLQEIQSYYKEEDIELRYKLCAELEYKIIFDYSLVLPLCIKDTTNKILVSNLMPYQRMEATYGLSPFKFKLRKLKEKDYTQQDIAQLKQEYEKGKKQQ